MESDRSKATLTVTAATRPTAVRRGPAAVTRVHTGFVNRTRARPTSITSAQLRGRRRPVRRPDRVPDQRSGSVSANYAFVSVDCTLTVGKATLTVTASTPANGVYGDAVPAVTAGYSGFVLGEGPADLDTAPSCVTDYVQGDGPAVYTTSCWAACPPTTPSSMSTARSPSARPPSRSPPRPRPTACTAMPCRP